VVSALSAEAPPPDQRGRFMAATQLAWGASGVVGPLLYTFLLHLGSLPLWGGGLALCLLWVLTVEIMSGRMPLARQAVTNLAEVEQIAPAPAAFPE
jgi:MFS family permease